MLGAPYTRSASPSNCPAIKHAISSISPATTRNYFPVYGEPWICHKTKSCTSLSIFSSAYFLILFNFSMSSDLLSPKVTVFAASQSSGVRFNVYFVEIFFCRRESSCYYYWSSSVSLFGSLLRSLELLGDDKSVTNRLLFFWIWMSSWSSSTGPLEMLGCGSRILRRLYKFDFAIVLLSLFSGFWMACCTYD